jgi:hypothetical protein
MMILPTSCRTAASRRARASASAQPERSASAAGEVRDAPGVAVAGRVALLDDAGDRVDRAQAHAALARGDGRIGEQVAMRPAPRRVADDDVSSLVLGQVERDVGLPVQLVGIGAVAELAHPAR